MRDDEKRDDQRLSLLGELPGEIMVFEPMLIREISRSGVTVETRFPLQLDSLHDLRLLLNTLPVIVKARVVHSRISDVDQEVVTYRSGMEFIEAPDRVLDAIGAFMDGVKTARA